MAHFVSYSPIVFDSIAHCEAYRYILYAERQNRSVDFEGFLDVEEIYESNSRYGRYWPDRF